MRVTFNFAFVVSLWFMAMIQTIDSKIITSYTESTTSDISDSSPVLLPPDIKAINGKMSLNDAKDCFQYVVEKNQTAVNISVTSKFEVPKKGLNLGPHAVKFNVYDDKGRSQRLLLSCSNSPTQISCTSNYVALPNGVNLVCIENKYPTDVTFDYGITLSPPTRANEYWESQEGDAYTPSELPPLEDGGPIFDPVSLYPRIIPRGKNFIKGDLSGSDMIDCYTYKLTKAANVSITTTYSTERPEEASLVALVTAGHGLPRSNCPPRITKTLSGSATCDSFSFIKGRNYICIVNYSVYLPPSPDNAFSYSMKLTVPSA